LPPSFSAYCSNWQLRRSCTCNNPAVAAAKLSPSTTNYIILLQQLHCNNFNISSCCNDFTATTSIYPPAATTSLQQLQYIILLQHNFIATTSIYHPAATTFL
jgi:hypothetical protein